MWMHFKSLFFIYLWTNLFLSHGCKQFLTFVYYAAIFLLLGETDIFNGEDDLFSFSLHPLFDGLPLPSDSTGDSDSNNSF